MFTFACHSRREAELHFAMRHANIVEVLAFSTSSPVCIVMERMDESLYDFLHSGLELVVPEKIEILIGVCKVNFP